GESHGDTTQRGKWQGVSISGTRVERLTVPCSTVFPVLNSGEYTITNAGGMVFTRTDKIEGWKTTSPPVPNDPLAPNVGWSLSTAGCAWRQTRSFNECPSGYTLLQ